MRVYIKDSPNGPLRIYLFGEPALIDNCIFYNGFLVQYIHTGVTILYYAIHIFCTVLCTVNVDFVTFEYVLLIKYQSITRSCANMTNGRGGGMRECSVGQHHNVYCLLDLSKWQFHKKYCLVLLQREGLELDGEGQAIGLHLNFVLLTGQ